MNVRALGLWSAAVLAVALASSNPVVRALALIAALDVVVALAGRGRSLRPLLTATAMAAVLAVVLNLLLSHTGAHVLTSIPDSVPGIGGPVTLESLAFGAATAVGIAAAILGVAPLGLCAEPHELIDALPRPLERTATAAAAALTMVPGIARSFTAVRDAQRMRGWRPGGPRAWAEVLVPVALTAMEDSLQLAEAMEARAYGSGRRSRYRPAPRRAADAAVAVTALVSLVLTVLRVHAGVADWYPYPSLNAPAIDPLLVGACLLLVTPALVWRRPSSVD